MDGLVLTGGADVDPQIYGENLIPQMGMIDPKRDDFELKITKEALIGGEAHPRHLQGPPSPECRGGGGTLIQDIASQVPETLKHGQKAPAYYPSHTVRVQEGSRLHSIFSKGELGVNTFHHQAVKDLGEGLVATAWAPEGGHRGDGGPR